MTYKNNINPEYRTILEIVKPSSAVLDLGCGSGELLSLLVREKNIKGQGIEIDDRAIFECVAKGLSVFHDDIDSGLSEYADKSFDYVILSQCLQQVIKVDFVLTEALRVGHKVIIGIPNFAYIKARFQIFFTGRVPVTPALPYEWYNSPNLHFLSLIDFVVYCDNHKIIIEDKFYFNTGGRVRIFSNLLAQSGVFVLRENEASDMDLRI